MRRRAPWSTVHSQLNPSWQSRTSTPSNALRAARQFRVHAARQRDQSELCLLRAEVADLRSRLVKYENHGPEQVSHAGACILASGCQTEMSGQVFSEGDVIGYCESKLAGLARREELADLQEALAESHATCQELLQNLSEFDALQANYKKLLEECAEQQNDQRANTIKIIDNATEPFRIALQNLISSENQAVIIGLHDKSFLNGSVVELIGWHDEKQRWQVKTLDQCSLLVKATNLLQSDSDDLIELFGHPIYDG